MKEYTDHDMWLFDVMERGFVVDDKYMTDSEDGSGPVPSFTEQDYAVTCDPSKLKQFGQMPPEIMAAMNEALSDWLEEATPEQREKFLANERADHQRKGYVGMFDHIAGKGFLCEDEAEYLQHVAGVR